MIIDIIFLIVLITAVIKGARRGLIVAVFSLLAYIIGLAAALKLSAVVANMLGQATNIGSKWLPVLSFAIVFIGVVLLVNMVAKIIEKSFETMMLGGLNKLGGIIFYVLLYTFVFSVVIFYADQLHLFAVGTKNNSVSLKYIEPLAPKVLQGLSYILPFLKDVFADLQKFFSGMATQAS